MNKKSTLLAIVLSLILTHPAFAETDDDPTTVTTETGLIDPEPELDEGAGAESPAASPSPKKAKAKAKKLAKKSEKKKQTH